MKSVEQLNFPLLRTISYAKIKYLAHTAGYVFQVKVSIICLVCFNPTDFVTIKNTQFNG